ncbi:kazrin isoform X1 [Lingula anatina]|uniref:Kazrin isoform X1 n=2 Tax=Lingula anatina TaxID=7574 RepID=A0A1S3HC76_LINAN|nr:kazrin isoform X1 [Lingula anatina]|eukprot:XP_013382759.1 kazrin isoform X1 [Lingula anatina]
METTNVGVTMETAPDCSANCEAIGLAAIQSLDTLNGQIVQFLFTPKDPDLDIDQELTPRQCQALKTSMNLMRRLLEDAQGKFRKMVEDNKHLATHIDTSIEMANQQVHMLREELLDTNRKLLEISGGRFQNQGNMENSYNVHRNDGMQYNNDRSEIARLKEENARLQQQVHYLDREMKELQLTKDSTMKSTNGIPEKELGVGEFGEVKLELLQTKQELLNAKEALKVMKGDRKRLKAEKLDLLSQMKQLYGTLEDKEAELRDFIRNYEQRMKESDDTIKQLSSDKDEIEREKWEILKRARDATERSVSLRQQLDVKEKYIEKLQREFRDMKEQLSKHNKFDEAVLDLDPPPPSLRSPSTEELPPYQESPPNSGKSYGSDSPFCLTPTQRNYTADKMSPMSDFNSLEEISEVQDQEDGKKKRKKSFSSSISKVFSRNRNRRSINSDPRIEDCESNLSSHSDSNPHLSQLNQENYEEKLCLVEKCSSTAMSQWKAPEVLAWLEITMSLPMYGKMCVENVKSGKVLLGLSDSELESALGITHSFHRRKLRLAIEEQRDPTSCKYPKARYVDHTWVAHRWIHDIGLGQYQTNLESNLIDGRMLNVLTKKDLEKHLNIHRKFHQCSMLHGIELLRRVHFDKDLLSDRRSQCETVDCDPLVWTTERVARWIKNIDLQEYADNLKDSGVHGALMVLEPSFNAEAMAAALGIPVSKSYIRRHLASEMNVLIKPASTDIRPPHMYASLFDLRPKRWTFFRTALEASNASKKKTAGGSLGRSFERSFLGPGEDGEQRKKPTFRGSLGRALGRKMKNDIQQQTSRSSLSSSHRSKSIEMESTPV